MIRSTAGPPVAAAARVVSQEVAAKNTATPLHSNAMNYGCAPGCACCSGGDPKLIAGTVV